MRWLVITLFSKNYAIYWLFSDVPKSNQRLIVSPVTKSAQTTCKNACYFIRVSTSSIWDGNLSARVNWGGLDNMNVWKFHLWTEFVKVERAFTFTKHVTERRMEMRTKMFKCSKLRVRNKWARKKLVCARISSRNWQLAPIDAQFGCAVLQKKKTAEIDESRKLALFEMHVSLCLFSNLFLIETCVPSGILIIYYTRLLKFIRLFGGGVAWALQQMQQVFFERRTGWGRTGKVSLFWGLVFLVSCIAEKFIESWGSRVKLSQNLHQTFMFVMLSIRIAFFSLCDRCGFENRCVLSVCGVLAESGSKGKGRKHLLRDLCWLQFLSGCCVMSEHSKITKNCLEVTCTCHVCQLFSCVNKFRFHINRVQAVKEKNAKRWGLGGQGEW